MQCWIVWVASLVAVYYLFEGSVKIYALTMARPVPVLLMLFIKCKCWYKQKNR